jgi:hypothetical protein
MELVSARLELNWSDYSGERAVKRMKQPVLLIGGGKDTISPPADLAVLSGAAPPGSKTILLPVADHYMLPYFFQELDQPVKAWFQEHLAMDRQTSESRPDCGNAKVAPPDEPNYQKPCAQNRLIFPCSTKSLLPGGSGPGAPNLESGSCP